jgi:hypothetical protein
MPNPENLKGKGFDARPENINREGREKGAKTRATIARKWLDVEIKAKNPLTGIEELLSQEDLITLAQIKAARQGEAQAYKVLMDSRFGAPKQDIDIEGKHSINISIE